MLQKYDLSMYEQFVKGSHGNIRCTFLFEKNIFLLSLSITKLRFEKIK